MPASALHDPNNAVCLKGPGEDAAIIIPKGEDYTLVGTSNPAECLALVRDILNRTLCAEHFDNCFETENGTAISPTTLLAFSTYYYTSKILQLSDKKTIAHKAFLNQTEHFCRLNITDALSYPGVDRKYVNSYCFQLYYIEETLSRVYNLGSNWNNVK